VSEVSVEFGKLVLISVLRKTLSRRARVGDSRRFDHVKSRSNKGSSRRARELIVSLKSSVRRESTRSLFLSSLDRIRLKSPARTQGPFMCGTSSAKSSRKDAESWWSDGAYTFVTVKLMSVTVETRTVVRVCLRAMKPFRDSA